MSIELKSFNMYRGYDKSSISGEITFIGDLGEIKLKLTEETIAKITELFAAQIVSSVREVADKLSRESIGSNLLEHKE